MENVPETRLFGTLISLSHRVPLFFLPLHLSHLPAQFLNPHFVRSDTDFLLLHTRFARLDVRSDRGEFQFLFGTDLLRFFNCYSLRLWVSTEFEEERGRMDLDGGTLVLENRKFSLHRLTLLDERSSECRLVLPCLETCYTSRQLRIVSREEEDERESKRVACSLICDSNSAALTFFTLSSAFVFSRSFSTIPGSQSLPRTLVRRRRNKKHTQCCRLLSRHQLGHVSLHLLNHMSHKL